MDGAGRSPTADQLGCRAEGRRGPELSALGTTDEKALEELLGASLGAPSRAEGRLLAAGILARGDALADGLVEPGEAGGVTRPPRRQR